MATVSGGERPVRALVTQHEGETPGGLVPGRLGGHGIETDVVRIGTRRGDIQVSGYELVVPLGCEFAPYDNRIPWIFSREVRLLREAHESGTSVPGICFGSQLLARALGARCYWADATEIGRQLVQSRDPAFVSAGPWFQRHVDTVEPPAGADLLAESEEARKRTSSDGVWASSSAQR